MNNINFNNREQQIIKKEGMNMGTEITFPNNSNDFNIQQLINLMGQNAMTVQGMSQQLGIVATKVTNMENDMNSMKDEIYQLKNNEEVTTEQSAMITATAARRIREIIGEDEVDYKKYSKRFFGRLWRDARLNGGVGDKVAKTRKRNYQRAIDYIESWIPSGGVSKLKRDIDVKLNRLEESNIK